MTIKRETEDSCVTINTGESGVIARLVIVTAAVKMELVGVDKKSDKEAENLLKQFSLKNVQATKFEMKLEDRRRVWKEVFLCSEIQPVSSVQVRLQKYMAR